MLFLGFVFVAICLAIVNVVLNVLVYEKAKEIRAETTSAPATIYTAPPGTVSKEPGFKAAANFLLKSVDLSADPCKDFYAFSCGKFIRDNPPGTRSFGQGQLIVDKAIVRSINSTAHYASTTEQIVKKVFDSCVKAMESPTEAKTNEIYQIMKKQMNGFPMLDPNWSEDSLSNNAMWQGIGYFELHYGIPTFLQSYVSVDYRNNTRNALYLDQIALLMLRDYYVKPQFLNELNNYRLFMIAALKQFRNDIKSTVSDQTIETEATEAIELEISLAIASLPREELRNYEMLYNRYSLAQLERDFPNIRWDSYFRAFLENTKLNQNEYIVEMPTYFATLNSFLQGKEYSKKTFVNLLMMRFIAENIDYLSNGNDAYIDLYRIIRESNGRSSDWSATAVRCASFVEGVIPYGSGYIYLKTINAAERSAVQEDVSKQLDYVINAFLNDIKTMDWITKNSLEAANLKARQIVKNIGWPNWFDFSNTVALDKYHVRYETVLQLNDWWNIREALQYAYQRTENTGLLNEKPNRHNFLGSPALFNAWYQPNFNSITLPYASFNPPLYGFGYPQAYNYAGQGAVAGHELTHGFDDQGVQFNGVGELNPCDWDHCGWLDTKSAQGFSRMAQCVISQYAQNCCPLKTGTVRCASGEGTQGENIADIGGLLAAYNAYQRYVAEDRNGKEEDRLPGLEQFSPNQIFWIAYSRKWCENRSPQSLVRQLLSNPHAPGVCRVNQVLQNIPQFAKDFHCELHSPMYPPADERCHVWTGQ